MSQGVFQLASYTTSEVVPRVLPIRLQPETIAVSPTGATEALTGSQKVRAPGKSRKSYGVHCRYMTLSRKTGAPDGPYTGGSVSVKIAILTEAGFVAFPVGTVVEYAGQNDWVVASQTPELIR